MLIIVVVVVGRACIKRHVPVHPNCKCEITADARSGLKRARWFVPPYRLRAETIVFFLFANEWPLSMRISRAIIHKLVTLLCTCGNNSILFASSFLVFFYSRELSRDTEVRIGGQNALYYTVEKPQLLINYKSYLWIILVLIICIILVLVIVLYYLMCEKS